ncbi:Microtubules assembly and stabilization protein [Friedmanniomyces endolithicus]|nr:Microtubules assembly and stabilization protein [Friedmanniomyces endolithicus]
MLGILAPCIHDGGCILEHDHLRSGTTPASSSIADTSSSLHDQYSTLYHTGSAARWRRKQSDYFSHNGRATTTRLSAVRQRSMEEVHGVDVSWLHHPGKSDHHRKTVPAPKPAPAPPTPSKQLDRKALPQQTATATDAPLVRSAPVPTPEHAGHRPHHSPAVVTPPTISEPMKNTAPAAPSTPTPAANNGTAGAKPQSKRPTMLGRSSSRGASDESKTGGRRSSWMNSISSKFSSSSPQQTGPERAGAMAAQQSKQQVSVNGLPSPAAESLNTHHEEAEDAELHLAPVKSKDSSFFSSLTRRLSSASTGSMPKSQMAMGGVCPRQVLNVDPNRQRCLVPDMDPARLRRVSFCVDVEIAGRPHYYSEEDEEDKTDKKKDIKTKERAEGAALRRPQAIEEEKEREGDAKLDAKASRSINVPRRDLKKMDVDESEANGGASPPDGSPEDDRDQANRKKEKKLRSEAERKERKEKRRRKAEESGSVPVELQAGDEEDATAGSASNPIHGSTLSESNGSAMDTPPPIGSFPETPPLGAGPRQDKPTTDPVRIYRRCCQLRETPILKRITEQLMSPTCTLPSEPGIVNCLDLTGSRLQLADVTTLGDWLAVVPVRLLKFEDADLSDEGVRCILAGLLAAKRPQPTKRSSVQPRHRGGAQVRQYMERAGVVEKLNLKHNPRITRLGWKHISSFIYMCRSLKAIDLSMNQFPETLPASTQGSMPVKSPGQPPAPAKGEGKETDAAEIFYKCLCERVGGSRLEELQVSECGLTSDQVRKVVDGAVVCGISRLGLAGNHLDDQALEHAIHYFRSGVCQGLDLGGNDMHGKLGLIADAINQNRKLPCWGLSLAGCNLHTSDLKALFPALSKLPDFRFIDLSHNRDLCTRDNGTISLFRRYMSHFRDLKRIHLADVGMSAQQAIALADCLPDGPRLAHLNILENPMLSALAQARDEGMQEEACAVYASLMAAVRVSSTLICIDIDVPSPENSEVVKALAKQVVAYSLRNMEQFAIAEATGHAVPNATAKLTGPHGGERMVKEITVPDVLMHLVGHVDGISENHDGDDPAPDEDYIVGGTGVVKALQYVLGEKAEDLRRSSMPSTPISGAMTPREGRPGSSAGFPPTEEQRGKAKKMSKNLLESARKIRTRLQPALIKEATAGDELAYRRLLFLDQTLQSIVERFEIEYPETRTYPPGISSALGAPSSTSTASSTSDRKTNASLATSLTEPTSYASEDDDYDHQHAAIHPLTNIPRHGSEVSLASRALSLEEGRLHRLGQHLRREIVDSPTALTAPAPEKERIKKLGEKLEAISGAELRDAVQGEGWESVLRRVGGTFDDLRALQEQDPEGFRQFEESQRLARMNMRG